LVIMDRARIGEAVDEWLLAHRAFHHMCTARAEGPLAKAVRTYGEQSDRYLLTYQRWHPDAFNQAHREHVALLRAVSGTDPVLAGSLMAEHLSRTAMNMLSDLHATDAQSATRQALAMATATSL
jgi:DNA-binding GntR family transcriptional regulator